MTSNKDLSAVMDKLVKRIRENSRSFSKRNALSALRRNEYRKNKGLQELTSFSSVRTKYPPFSSVDANVLMAHFSKNGAFEDISAVTAPDGEIYLYSNGFIPEKTVKALVLREERIAVIVKTVRENAMRRNRLTDMESLVDIFTDLSHEALDNHMTCLVNDTRYADIGTVASASGAVFLYSRDFLTVETAMSLLRIEEILVATSQKVRKDSKEGVLLTRFDSFMDVLPEMESSEFQRYIDTILADERFEDIRSLTGPTDIDYLFSETFITESYARILARTEIDNPCLCIAETVREESRLYPRPTNGNLFRVKPFNMATEDIAAYIEQTQSQPEYADIQCFRASTGTPYLFSTRHMNEKLARPLAETEEVDIYKNQ